jgi:hypothetical protein
VGCFFLAHYKHANHMGFNRPYFSFWLVMSAPRHLPIWHVARTCDKKNSMLCTCDIKYTDVT